jgi:hypothetical protein
MAKSLIRKNQLHPDISDLVGQYGSGFFITSGQVSGISVGTAAASLAFSGNRTITRTSFPYGVNVGGSTVIDFLNNVFFPPPPFIPASINLTNQYPNLREYGNINDILTSVTFNGSITANSSTGITNLIYKVDGTQKGSTVSTPGATFNNIVTSLNIINTTSISVEVTRDLDINGNTSSTSAAQTINFVPPYYWGSYSNQNLIPASIRDLANLTVHPYFNKGLSSSTSSLTLTFPSGYMYFVYPGTWNDLSSVELQGGYEGLPTFTKTEVTNTGWLLNGNNLSQLMYKKYVFNNFSTLTNYTMTFKF